jgi:ribonuclease D
MAEWIADREQFTQLCERIRRAGIAAFDTEFVSESYYRPKLCLLQFAVEGEAFLVDPFAVTDLSEWWALMANPDVTVVVHGGREELRFAQREGKVRPCNIIDVQIVEGLLSRGYPLGYGTLVQRVLGIQPEGKETRTDWRTRPLSKDQLSYAAEDVEHLLAVWQKQSQRLEKLKRRHWVDQELERRIQIVLSEDEGEPWRRLNGISRMSRRELGLLRDLYVWREEEADRQDRPVRWVIRDDLLAEIARRQPTTTARLEAVRGMDRPGYRKLFGAIAKVVKQAQKNPEESLPHKIRSPQHPPQDDPLSRILLIALANQCAELNVSLGLVGTNSDLLDLVRWELEGRKGPLPLLMDGWRKEVCGTLLTDILEGRVALRVINPKAEAPLAFVKCDEDAGK